MVEFLYQIDVAVFRFLNGAVANPVFDRIMPVITKVQNWRIPILAIVLVLLIFGGRKGRITVLLVVLILTLSDQVSSSLIKPWVGRIRPCFVLDDVRLLIGQPRSPSFPSSHAANLAGMAVLFSLRYRKWMWIPISLALIVSYSRVYLGVHYPSDVIGGWLVGILCAAVILGAKYGIETIRRNRTKEAKT